MSIVNIADLRKHHHRFNNINAIVEAAWHDNTCDDSDQVPNHGEGPDHDYKENISLHEAIKWANGYGTSVILYIYDEGKGV